MDRLKSYKACVLLAVFAMVISTCGMIIAALNNDVAWTGAYFLLAFIGWALAVRNYSDYKRARSE